MCPATGPGGLARASYAWTRNAAGMITAETSVIAGDPANGTTTYAYDPLARLTTYTPPPVIEPQVTSWAAVPNRTSLTLGTGPTLTTTYDPANRPTGDSAGGTYVSDLDGRLTTLPGSTLTYDSLGRLTGVTTGGASSAYTYDPLDRLRTVSRAGSVQRFRYVGATTAAAQVLDGSGIVIRSIATDWTGQHLADWTATGADERLYGTNGHGDLTWTADGSGAVSATARYDPWGVLRSSTGASLPDFRFQGSWSDASTGFSWAITRWYAPTLGRFLTEDSLLGSPEAPASRHLYAYGAGEPVGRVDPDGRHSMVPSVSTTWDNVARRYYGSTTVVGQLAGYWGNFSNTTSPVRAGYKYRLPDWIWDGARRWYHTVYRRDDPILKHDGYAFGAPYQGNPLRDGWHAWQPIVISPTSCSSSCLQSSPTSTIDLPAGRGPWQWIRGWRSDTMASGWVGFFPAVLAVGTRASESHYSHGSLVTMWNTFDIRQYATACGSPFSVDFCADSFSATYTINSGSLLNGVGYRSTNRRVTTWRWGDSEVSSRPLSSPPWDYGHFNVWVPRAWGRPRSFSAQGSLSLQDSAVMFSSGVISASFSNADYFDSYSNTRG